MKHGGDLLSYKDDYQGELVDYSSNINPLGFNPGLDEEITKGLQSLKAYPDIKYRKLKKSVADYLGCEEESVVLGNGSVELIDNFIFFSKKVILCTPSFSEYELRARVHDKEVVRIPYSKNFKLDIKAIAKILSEGDTLILGNPNNPTGLRISRDELVKIYDLARAAKAFIMLDEAFFEFCPADYDSIELFRTFKYENISILRASTKFFALPGIRLGYGCTSKSMAEKVEEIQLPWSINSLAEIAGRYIFKDEEYIERSRVYIDGERRYLLNEFSEIKGIKAYESHANFILIKLLFYNEEKVFAYFLKNGIIIRKCSSFIGLEQDHIRIAVKDRANNERLLEIFRKLEKEKVLD